MGDQTAVDLPDADDVANGAGSALEPGCEPVECELWRADLRPGELSTGGGMLFHYDMLYDSFHVTDGAVTQVTEVPVLTALDLESGSELWSLELSDADLEGGFGAHYFDETLLVVSGGRSISAVDPRDGTLLWEQVTSGAINNPTRNAEGHLVGYGFPNESPDEMSPDAYADPIDGGFVVSLDWQTGEQRWLVGGVSVQGWTEDLGVALRADGELVGIDLASGEVAWAHGPEDATGLGNIMMGNGTVAIAYPASEPSGRSQVVVLDTLTGEPIGGADVDAPPERWFDLVGRGLIVTWEPEDWSSELPSGPMTLVDVEHDASPAVIGDVISWTALGESGIDEWQFGRRGPTTGLAVLTADDDGTTLRVLDANGIAQWEVEFGAASEGCCWSVQRSAYGDDIVVAPPHQDGRSAQSYAVADGSVTSTQLSARLSAFDHVWWLGQLAIGTRPGGVIVEGPAGHFISEEEVMLAVFEPVLVLQTSTGLVAIDHEVLLGDSS